MTSRNRARIVPRARRALVVAVAAAGAVGALAAAGQPPPGMRPSGTQVQAPMPSWPEPPSPPRIRFVGSLSPDASQAKPSVFGRLWRVLVGPGDRLLMRQPYGLAAAANGKLYVTDSAGGLIHVYDLLRRGYSRIETDGTSLVGIAARGEDLYVTDSARARVFCVTTGGKKRWSIGPGQGLQRPTGIVAVQDRLFVVDTLASQIVSLDQRGLVTGRFGTRGSGDGQFNFPTSIAADRDGRLYVTDTLNFRVQVFNQAGIFLSSMGRLGDGSGDFTRPKGIGVDSDGNVHVVEGLYDVVQMFRQDGRFLLAYGEPGSGNGQLWLATGLTIANDTIYVADSANSRVQVYQYLREQR